MLRNDGWMMRKAPALTAQKAKLRTYKAGDEKIWYVGGTDLSRVRSYME